MRDADLIDHVKAMRRAPTEPEQRPWRALRASRFGARFRRQKVVGPYTVDFAARDPMLVVEIGGDTHAARERLDAARTDFLERQGYRVIRFTNHNVMGNPDGVLTIIARHPTPRTPPLPTRSGPLRAPEGERAT